MGMRGAMKPPARRGFPRLRAEPACGRDAAPAPSLSSAGCALALPRCCRVQMADRDGQCIGSIGGLGYFLEIQQERHHLLDLMFFGAAVSDHRGLDRKRRIFGDLESGGSRCQHGNPAHLAELQGGLHVSGVENVFDGNPVGPVLGDEFLQADRDARQPCGHGIVRRNFNGAADNADQAILVAIIVAAIVAAIGDQFDDSVSGIFRAAVDAEDAHAGSVAGELSAISYQFFAFGRNGILVCRRWRLTRAPKQRDNLIAFGPIATKQKGGVYPLPGQTHTRTGKSYEEQAMKIGVLTGGGDCPGLNAVIRAVVRKGTFHYEDGFVGFMEGWRGLLEDKTMELDLESVGGILPRGGTILRTSRTNPAKYP